MSIVNNDDLEFNGQCIIYMVITIEIMMPRGHRLLGF